MPHHETTSVTGTVRDVFAHRFVVQTAAGPILADLGPDGARSASLKTGDAVQVWGEQKPSELKVRHLVLNGAVVAFRHDTDENSPVDPAPALQAVRATGYVVVAEPREKRKHFEILAKDPEGQHLEHHIQHDGEIRTSRLGDPGDTKWTPLRPAQA